MRKPTKRTVGAQKIDEKDSEDAAGAYAEPGSPEDTGETDTPIEPPAEPAPHVRPPSKRRKKKS